MARLERIIERLELKEFQLKALLDVTKAINNTEDRGGAAEALREDHPRGPRHHTTDAVRTHGPAGSGSLAFGNDAGRGGDGRGAAPSAASRDIQVIGSESTGSLGRLRCGRAGVPPRQAPGLSAHRRHRRGGAAHEPHGEAPQLHPDAHQPDRGGPGEPASGAAGVGSTCATSASWNWPRRCRACWCRSDLPQQRAHRGRRLVPTAQRSGRRLLRPDPLERRLVTWPAWPM